MEAGSGKRGYDLPVDTDEVSAAPESARVLRLALNVLWNGRPNGMDEGPMRDALESIRGWINEVESASLRRLDSGAALPHYPAHQSGGPPLPEIMEQIATAVLT